MTNVPSSLDATQNQGSRKPYTTPSLEGLGAVSDLVMGSGTLGSEAGGVGSGMMVGTGM